MYYHRNSPEPPSVGAMEGESEPGMQSVEMDFPSGYTDPWPEERKDVSIILVLYVPCIDNIPVFREYSIVSFTLLVLLYWTTNNPHLC